jgi:diguanylate cyclase (GGDEF)-like protein
MKPLIDALIMSENMMSERSWRRDPVETVAALETSEPAEATEPGSMTVSLLRQCSLTARTWACACVERFASVQVGFEQVLHPFVVVLETAASRADVEAALLQAVRKMAPATRIELIGAADQAVGEGTGGPEEPECHWSRQDGQSVLVFPLQFGAAVRGRLRIYTKSGAGRSVSQGTRRRVLTLCTLAACALEKFHRPSEWPWEHDSTAHADEPSHAGSGSNAARIAKDFFAAPMLRDATFLNAVLPFALSQAQRHREPLSLLWMEIDRLAGIQELLGRAAVDALIRHVGEAVAALLRTSDIVARLDDDRIVVILPRATTTEGLVVAERIRRDVFEKNRDAAVTPGVTLSIGVATFPTCAHNVSSLFNAADEALAQARSQGRDRAALAPPRSTIQPGPHLHTPVHDLSEDSTMDEVAAAASKNVNKIS